MMNPMYTTIENQIRTDGGKGLLYDHFDSYTEAVAKFHTASAAAATSGIPYHAVFVLQDNGMIVKSEIFDRRIAPEPAVEG